MGFTCIHPEAEVLISVAEVDVKMTCFIDRDPIGDATVKYDELWRGHIMTKSFNLDLRSQPDERIVVTLQVGQTGQPVEELPCVFKFTSRRSPSLPTHGLEELKGASSSHTLRSSHRSTCLSEILENNSGRQEDFDEKLTAVARNVVKHEEIDHLWKALGSKPEDIERYVYINVKNPEVSYVDTLSMLRDWRKKETEATECEALKGALRKAGQIRLADELFDDLVEATARVQVHEEQTDTQNTRRRKGRRKRKRGRRGLQSHETEQLQGASSSQTLQASHQRTDETLENISGRREDFDEKLTTVARNVTRFEEIDDLGKALGLKPEDIQRYVDTNMRNPDVSYMGTLSMLRYWRKKQTKATKCEALKGVLREAGQIRLADELFGTL